MKVSISNVIIIQDSKVLLVQEKKPSAYGLWDLPGGAQEENETSEQAAYREVKEELDVELVEARFIKTYPLQISDVNFDLNMFIGSIRGNINIKDDELMAYGWFSLEAIMGMKDNLRGSVIIDQVRDTLATHE